MKAYCPRCERDAYLTPNKGTKIIEVRGLPVEVETEYRRCSACGEEDEDPAEARDALERAYREYRRRHRMMQPEEIRYLRKLYGLTQREMAMLLGWGLVTLSRYENGALQDDAHDKTLRLVSEPHNLIRLLELEPAALRDEKRKKVIEQFRDSQAGVYGMARIYEERFGRYDANALSGYRRFDMAKLLNTVLFFCEGGRLRTSLNKILFFADFKHFKEYAGSITGTRYLKTELGPTPEKWHYYLTLLIDRQTVDVTEIFADGEIAGERLTATKNPDLSIFSNTELLILAFVKDHFKTWNAKMISNLIQNERGYIETPNRGIIPYPLAAGLGI
jgi:putative zinc finger/helix-turn-helix YgiT family protein